MNRIKELRKKIGITQTELAKKTGLSKQSISWYELNRRKPKIEAWQKLADFFGVTVPYLQGVQAVKAPAMYIVQYWFYGDGGVLGIFTSKESAFEAIEKTYKDGQSELSCVEVDRFDCIDKFDESTLKKTYFESGCTTVRSYEVKIDDRYLLHKKVIGYDYTDYKDGRRGETKHVRF